MNYTKRGSAAGTAVIDGWNKHEHRWHTERDWDDHDHDRDQAGQARERDEPRRRRRRSARAIAGTTSARTRQPPQTPPSLDNLDSLRLIEEVVKGAFIRVARHAAVR